MRDAERDVGHNAIAVRLTLSNAFNTFNIKRMCFVILSGTVHYTVAYRPDFPLVGWTVPDRMTKVAYTKDLRLTAMVITPGTPCWLFSV